MSELTAGNPAPEFRLSDQHGNTVCLADFRARKLLLYFYPKADTPGCTTQACSVRDSLAELEKHDVAVVGVSPDKPTAQNTFDEKHGLGFPLLADTETDVAKAYGVWREKVNFGKKYMGILRSAFLIDENGTVEQAWYKVKPADTVPNVLAMLRT